MKRNYGKFISYYAMYALMPGPPPLSFAPLEWMYGKAFIRTAARLKSKICYSRPFSKFVFGQLVKRHGRNQLSQECHLQIGRGILDEHRTDCRACMCIYTREFVFIDEDNLRRGGGAEGGNEDQS
jgi:hypothetical protein